MQKWALPEAASVRSLIARGAPFALGSLLVRQGTGFATTAVVARVLAPEDFGLMAMYTSVAGFLALLFDLGLSWAVVQTKTLNDRTVTGAFWLTAFLGLALWFSCILLADSVAAFFEAPLLNSIVPIASSSVLFLAASVTPMALLKRQMRQRALAMAQLGGAVSGSVLAIWLAFLDFGVWSLVAQLVGNTAIVFALSLSLSGLRLLTTGVDFSCVRLLSFGSYVTGCNLLSYVQINLDQIIIGKYSGAEDLGFYSRATFLKSLPAVYSVAVFTDLMIPALSAAKGDKAEFAEILIQSTRRLALIASPLCLFMAVCAHEIVAVLYGPGWESSAEILVVLCAASILLPISQTSGWVFIATGRVQAMFWLSISTLPIVVAAYIVAAPAGLSAILGVTALLFGAPLPLLTAYIALRHYPDLRRSMFDQLLGPVWHASVAAACALAAKAALSGALSAYLVLVICGSVYLATYVISEFRRSIVSWWYETS